VKINRETAVSTQAIIAVVSRRCRLCVVRPAAHDVMLQMRAAGAIVRLNTDAAVTTYPASRFCRASLLLVFRRPLSLFIRDLKPSFSANPSHCGLSFSSSGLTIHDSPDF